TTAVPTTMPVRYGTQRRAPWAEPAATRLIVAGPGVPMIASDVATRVRYVPGMPETLRGVDPDRLERSCIRFGPPPPGIERAEVFLPGRGSEPHRHDTYAVGITTAGVQSFRYRGERRICLPGQLHVLHPDEEHDGAPATAAGLGYRILYLAPELVSAAL